MQTPAAKPMHVEAKLANAGQSVSTVASIQSDGSLNVVSVERIYLRMYAGTVASMIREGNDLIVVDSDGEVIRLVGFYEGSQPRQLLLMDNEGGLVMMETSRAVSDGPMPVYSTGVIELSPFEGLTSKGDAGGVAMVALGALGVAAAAYALLNDDDDGPRLPPEPAPDTTPPAAPTGVAFNADGSKLTGSAEAGSTITVRDAAGNVIGTGRTGTDGRFEVSLNPPLINKEPVTVTATDAANNVSPPANATAPDLTAPAAATNLDVNDTGTVLTGEGEPGAKVTVTGPDGSTIGTGTVGGDGTFTVTLDPPQTDSQTVTVVLQDEAGNNSPPANATAPDLTAPAAAKNLDVNETGTVLTGEGEPGAKVTVTGPDGSTIGTGTVGDDGTFSIPLDPPQTDSQTVTVVLQDEAGNNSPPANATAPDLTPPAAATNLEVNETGTVLTGEGEIGADVTVTGPDGSTIGTGTVGDDGTFSIPLDPPQVEGQTVTVVLQDEAGNNSPDASALAPDLSTPQPSAAPTVAVPEAADGITPDERADGIQVEVTLPEGRVVGDRVVVQIANGANAEHTLMAEDIAAGKVTVTLSGNLPLGNYSVSAVLVDAAGVSSARSAPVTFDVVGDGGTPALPLVVIADVTADNVLNLEESQGSITLTGSLQHPSGVTNSFQQGDLVEVTAGGTTYRTTVAADGTWSVSVRGSDLVSGTVTAKGYATGADGVVRPVDGSADFGVDLLPPSNLAPSLSVPDGADGVVTEAELADGLDAIVGLPAGVVAGDVLVVNVTVAGQVETFTHILTPSDISSGTVTVPLGSDYNDGNYVVSAFLQDPAGNRSPSASVGFEIDTVDLDVGTAIANVTEVDASIVASGQITIDDATAAATITLSGPVGQFTSRGETITWSNAPNGDLVGTAGGRTVVTVTMDNSGNYTVRLSSGVDHPAGSNLLTLPITVTVNDGTDVATGAININVTDGAPTVSAPLTITPNQPGLQSGTLVADMGLDGGYMETVTVDGLTFTYTPANDSVSVSGSSTTVQSHSFANGKLTVTTIRGETVEIDMQTGDYKVNVTGQEAQAPGDDEPFVSMAEAGGLLGLINANVLGLLKLEEDQFFTASDLNNDLKTVELTYFSAVSLSGLRFVFDEKLAAELGIKVVQNGFTAILPGYNKITIEAVDGGTLDNWKLNEFLGTMTLGGGISPILQVDLLSTLSIKATDSEGNVAEKSDFKLADASVGAPVIGAVLPEEFISGSEAGDNIVAPDGPTGAGLNNRIYGYGGDDRLEGGRGNDILRGGSGNDILLGGDGNDILVGGTGADVMTGGAGLDIFRFERGDQINAGGVVLDTILDFNNASLAQEGDVLDLSDLLQGEGRVGKSAGNLGNYLHFELTAEGTLIHISTTGGYVGGFNASNASATDQRILLKGVDLVTGFGSDIAIINDLLASNKLLVDVQTSSDPSAHGNLQIGGTVVDSDGDRGSTSVIVDDVNLDNPDNNTAPTIGAEAETTLGLLGGNLLGYNLSSQDLLVADADNNLAKVTVEYAPVLAVNLSALTFAYDTSLAAAMGYEVRITQSEGVLGLIGPRAKIEVFSATGEPLDNAEINAFLKTVHLVDPQGGLLSSSLLSLGVLNAITLTAEDVWQVSSSQVIGSFLDVNLLNSIGGNHAGFAPLNLFNAVEWLGDNAGTGAVADFADVIRGYLEDGIINPGEVVDFADRVRDFWDEALNASPVSGLVDRIADAFDEDAVQDFADSLQGLLDGDWQGGHIADFIARAQAHLDAHLAGSPVGEWLQHVRQYLSSDAIAEFTARVQDELTARFADKAASAAEFAALVQADLKALLDGSYLSDWVVHLREHLSVSAVAEFAEAKRAALADGFDADDVRVFIADVRAHIEASLAGTSLGYISDSLREYLGASAIADFAADVSAYLQTQYGNSRLAQFASQVKAQLQAGLEGTGLGELVEHLRGLFDSNAITDFAADLRTQLSNGIDAIDLSDFIARARAHIESKLDGSYLSDFTGRLGEYLSADVIIEFAGDVQNYLMLRFDGSGLADFADRVKTHLEAGFENANLGEISARIHEYLQGSVFADFAADLQGYLADGISAGDVQAFVTDVQTYLADSFSGAHLGSLAEYAQQYLSASAIIDFAARLQEHLETQEGLTFVSDFANEVKSYLDLSFEDSNLAELAEHIRDQLGAGFDNAGLDQFFSNVQDQLGGLIGGLSGNMGEWAQLISLDDMISTWVDDGEGWLGDYVEDTLTIAGTAFSPAFEPALGVPAYMATLAPLEETVTNPY